MEVEVEVELEDAEEAEELEHGLPVAARLDMGDTVHNSFIKAVHNSLRCYRFVVCIFVFISCSSFVRSLSENCRHKTPCSPFMNYERVL